MNVIIRTASVWGTVAAGVGGLAISGCAHHNSTSTPGATESSAAPGTAAKPVAVHAGTASTGVQVAVDAADYPFMLTEYVDHPDLMTYYLYFKAKEAPPAPVVEQVLRQELQKIIDSSNPLPTKPVGIYAWRREPDYVAGKDEQLFLPDESVGLKYIPSTGKISTTKSLGEIN